MVKQKTRDDAIEELMDEWWDTKNDFRDSGEFSWDEIKDCVHFIFKKLKIISWKQN